MNDREPAFLAWYANRSRTQLKWLAIAAYLSNCAFFLIAPNPALDRLRIVACIALIPGTAFFWVASPRAYLRGWELLALINTFIYLGFTLTTLLYVEDGLVAEQRTLVAMVLTLIPLATGFASCLRGQATTLLSVATWALGTAVFARVPSFAAPIWVGVSLILALSALFASVAAFQLERALRREFIATQQLDEEHNRAEGLLRNVLPAAIAERLKAKPGSIADRFDEATVLFADIVGFTPLTQRLPAEQLVAILDGLFSAFDDIAEKHGLEKIKTIGDAYMVVGGIPAPRADHVHAIAAMALEMRDAVASRATEHGTTLRLRIGIDTGPVVAGVIGKRKFLYDLWGDTVNTASRMESHGVEDAVHVTEAAYLKLRDKFVLEARGPIQVKGKGEMNTWWLKSPVSAA